MPSHPAFAPSPDGRRLYPALAAGLIAAVAGLNLGYLLSGRPLGLAPDEAHYWDWSRRLDWCYYSKGPLIAWLIRAGRELAGEWSVATVGTELVAVRLVAVGCQAVLLAGLYVLAARSLGCRKLGLATVAVAVTLPPVQAVGTLATIDGPFLASWVWAAVFAHAALFRGGGGRAWLAAGLAAAVGVLAKHTMLLFPAAVGGYLAATPSARGHLRRPGFWLFVGVSAAGLGPIVWWNATHGWVGVWHVATQAVGPAGRAGGWDPLGPLAYVAGQAGMLVGFWLAAFLAAVWQFRPVGRTGGPVPYLWSLAAPIWALFAVASLKAKGQPNWPGPAYVAGLVLAVGWFSREMAAAGRWRRGALVGGAAAAGAVGIGVAVFARIPWAYRPTLARLLPPPTADRPAPIRRLDPTARLAGWPELAAAVDRLRDQAVRDDGREPVIAGMTWTIPGELGFYCRGRPVAYSIGLAVTDRHSQYDVWRPNPVADAQAFRGRSFLYVGERLPDMGRVWDRVAPPVEVTASDGGIPVAAWKVWYCRGFRGFPGGDGRPPAGGY